MIQTNVLDGLTAVGVAVAYTGTLFWLLAVGRLSTARELREKDKRILALEATLRVRDHQLTLVLTEAMTTLNPVLKALRDAKDADVDGPQEDG